MTAQSYVQSIGAQGPSAPSVLGYAIDVTGQALGTLLTFTDHPRLVLPPVVVPASGQLIVRLGATFTVAIGTAVAGTGAQVFLRIIDELADVIVLLQPKVTIPTSGNVQAVAERSVLLTGLTPGAVKSYKAQYAMGTPGNTFTASILGTVDEIAANAWVLAA